MHIIVPPITRPIRLTDYAPELVREDGEPVTVWAWVNPPARMIGEMQALRERSKTVRDQLAAGAADLQGEIRAISEAVSAWYAAAPVRHWSAIRKRLRHACRNMRISVSRPSSCPAIRIWKNRIASPSWYSRCSAKARHDPAKRH